MKIDREYIMNKEIDQMSIEEIKDHFIDYTWHRMRSYLDKKVIRQSTYEKAWKMFVTGGESVEKVRKEYKKIIAKCEIWRVKFGKKFKHIPAWR